VLRRAVARDQPLLWDDVDLPDSRLRVLWERQAKLPPEKATA
jgi:hypothetical protein